MCEIKKNLKNLEQTYKIFQQQQFTFITALERCRESAHDKIKPVASLGQVQYYLENHCSNSTDRRILNMFLDLCRNLADFCRALENMETEARTAGGSIATCKTLLSPSNDLTCLRARYPHDQVNHLSCDEAKNFYGGVVSLIPIIMDNLKLGVSTLEKPQPTPRLNKQSSSSCPVQKKAEAPTAKTGPSTCQNIAVQTLGTSTGLQNKSLNRSCMSANGVSKLAFRPAWRPTGRSNKF